VLQSRLGRLLALHINIRLGWKGLPGANGLAFTGIISHEDKSFVTLTQVANFIRLILLANKLECLSLVNHFKPSLIFLRRPEPILHVHMKGAPI
jgi:hypothetical protein